MNILTPCSSSFYLKTQPCRIRIRQRSSTKNLSVLEGRPAAVPSVQGSSIRIRKVLANTSIITRKVIRHPLTHQIVTNVSPIKGRTESFVLGEEEDDLENLVKLF